MSEDLEFAFSLLLNGASIGLMYSLIALGFVLVYKATDAINFAQGEFVMLAGLIVAMLLSIVGMPLIVAIAVTLAVMIGFGFGLERVVLRPLLGRPVVAVIMATIGLAAILRGVGPVIFGSETRAVSLPIGDEPIVFGPASLPPIQVAGAVVAIVFFLAFSWFFKKSRMGVAMRAVADNQQVAQAMGINVERYFALAWAMAGVVSALGGVVWGSMLGVDVHLALVGLKVFPVVILGGLDSIIGAIAGGLIIGVLENLAEFVDSQYLNLGNLYTVAPFYALIVILMIKPYGLFGTKQIERI